MIEIIPAIDIIDGECVRLTRGDYGTKKSYYKDPLDIARMFENMGIGRLHMVDLDGAKASRPVNLGVLSRVASLTSLQVQYGGGIKSTESLSDAFSAGASRVICGSIAVSEPSLFRCWLRVYGADKLILGADTRDGFVATNGWLTDSCVTVEQLVTKFVGDGLSQVICTDISRDGTLQGPSFGLYDKLQKRFPGVEITVSGGISSAGDIERLDRMGLRSVIVGKAIYEGMIPPERLRQLVAGSLAADFGGSL